MSLTETGHQQMPPEPALADIRNGLSREPEDSLISALTSMDAVQVNKLSMRDRMALVDLLITTITQKINTLDEAPDNAEEIIEFIVTTCDLAVKNGLAPERMREHVPSQEQLQQILKAARIKKTFLQQISR